jgi:hypothetical protein
VGDFTNGGSITLAPASTVSVSGNYNQTSAGSLAIQIANSSSSGFGRLIATGAVALGGAASLGYVGGYVPYRGQDFTFITGSTVTGQFAAVSYPTTANFLKPIAVYEVGAVRFRITTVADFNGDGRLDATDIFDFINTWLSGDPRADINGAGLAVQDIFDFLNLWFAN